MGCPTKHTLLTTCEHKRCCPPTEKAADGETTGGSAGCTEGNAHQLPDADKVARYPSPHGHSRGEDCGNHLRGSGLERGAAVGVGRPFLFADALSLPAWSR